MLPSYPCDVAPCRFRDTTFELLAGVRELNFNTLGWGDNEVVQLALVLPLCAKLVKLTLVNNRIGAVGAAALAKFLVVNGSLTSLR